MKLKPVAVSQCGTEIYPVTYCRLSKDGKSWVCFPSVEDAFNKPPTNAARYPAAPPGALFL